jgi:VWFA-related protein
MTHPLLVCSLAACLAAVPVVAAQRQESGPRTRNVYVTALDSSGAPAKDLTAADFAVREDGSVREVLKAGPATAPITLSILVDDSQASDPMIQEIRRGLTSLMDQMAGKAEIAIATFGERPTGIVDYTTSTPVLKRGVEKIFARQGAGAYLLDAIVEVSRGLQKRENVERPVILAITNEAGPEFSNIYHQPVLNELRKSGATFHALAVGTPSESQTDEMRNRGLVLSQGTQMTGGRRDQVLATSALPAKLKQVGDELLNQWVVTYSRPEALIPPEKIEVTSTRSGITVRAGRTAPQR